MATASDAGDDVRAEALGDDAPEPALDPKVVNRRDALKKAAIGAGIAGAVWSAPRIEGLSLVPDYAAAGTIPAGSTIQIKASSADCSLIDLRNCWGNCIPNPTFGSACQPFNFKVPAYAPAMATGTTNGVLSTPSVYTSTATLSNPAPPAPNQNEFFDVVWSGNADGLATGMAAVMFTLDPPFNMCSVTSLTGQVFNTNNFVKGPFPAPGLMLTNHTGTVPTPSGPVPAVIGADATFFAMSPPNMLNPQGADITITITCT